MTDADIADMQAQIVALRLAVEGAWLSLLAPSADPVGDAQRLGAQNVATIGQLDASSAEARAVRDAVVHHTERLWGSIGWQLADRARQAAVE